LCKKKYQRGTAPKTGQMYASAHLASIKRYGGDIPDPCVIVN
jgi:hypothetical protein